MVHGQPKQHCAALDTIGHKSGITLSKRTGQITVKRNAMISESSSRQFRDSVAANWQGSALPTESTLHQIAPYIGKMKSSMAAALVGAFTDKGETVYDPFCGSGTVALEAWAAGRNVIANDLNPYGTVLTRAKLFPCCSQERAIAEIHAVAPQAHDIAARVDLRTVPRWVRSFFHPETLRETMGWFEALTLTKSHFLLSCLLGILHHQRPGFLSYPSSHTVPYLRPRKFPRAVFSELYEYRPVQGRLEKKVLRAFRRVPNLNRSLKRKCHMRDAAKFTPRQNVNAIVTSPPYMRQLDYGRDNRLRLWFLGFPDWRSLDQDISPAEGKFLRLLRACLRRWQHTLMTHGLCVLVLGDARVRSYDMPLAEVVARVATSEVGGYSAVASYRDPIPEVRRARHRYSGSRTETILVLRNSGGT